MHSFPDQDWIQAVQRERQAEEAVPTKCQSDNGSELRNRFMAQVLEIAGAIARHSSPYNPRTNGKVERQVATVSEKFAKEVTKLGGLEDADVATIKRALASAIAIINTRPGRVSTYAPYQVTVSQHENMCCTLLWVGDVAKKADMVAAPC